MWYPQNNGNQSQQPDGSQYYMGSTQQHPGSFTNPSWNSPMQTQTPPPSQKQHGGCSWLNSPQPTISKPPTWGYGQQQVNTQPHLGQQPPRPQQHRERNSTMAHPVPTSSSDPWNWGWDESGSSSSNSGSQNVPVTNNTMNDPTWDWSVDGTGNKQDSSNIASSFSFFTDHSSLQNSGNSTGGMFDYFRTPNSSSVSVKNSPASLPPQRSYQEHHVENTPSLTSLPPQASVVNNNVNNNISNNNSNHNYIGLSENRHQVESAQYNYTANSDVFPVTEKENINQFSDHESLRTQHTENNLTLEPLDRVLNHNRATDLAAEINNRLEFLPEAKSVDDVRSLRGATGNEGLPSQWSTESLPSQGSEEVSQALEGSGQSDITPPTSNMSRSSPSQSRQESCESQSESYDYRMDHSLRGYTDRTVPGFESSFVTVNSSNKPFEPQSFTNQEHSYQDLDSKYQRNKSFDESDRPPSDLRHSNYTPPHSSALLPPPISSVDKNFQSLQISSSYKSNISEVENKEIVSPELRQHSPSPSNSFPPPPVLPPPLIPGSSNPPPNTSNPYSGRKGPRTHKYTAQYNPSSGGSSMSHEDSASVFSHQSARSDVALIDNFHFQESKNGVPFTRNSEFHRKLSNTFPLSSEDVNLETVPDNKERPDFIEHQNPLQVERKLDVSSLNQKLPPVPQNSGRNGTIPWTLESQNVDPDNFEVAPRGPNRDQYLETGQLIEDEQETLRELQPNVERRPDNGTPPSFQRMVPGQHTDQSGVTSTTMLQFSNSFGDEVSTPPPGLHRMVPGEFTKHQKGPIQRSDTESGSDDTFLCRLVPGQPQEEENVTRFAPGDENNESLQNRVQIDDDPPPGLRRMIPGESSSPETQSGAVPAGSFEPIDSVPSEPRVVTGVAEDDIDSIGSQNGDGQLLSLPLQSGSNIHIKSEPTSPAPDQMSANNSLQQPPSERSETIGSDNVETYTPTVSDSRDDSIRREVVAKERDRRHRDDQEGEDHEVINSRRRDRYGGSEHDDDSLTMNRFRDDRDGRLYDTKHDRTRTGERSDHSPVGHSFRSKDYHQQQGSRRDARSIRRDEDDADSEDYYSDHDRESEYRSREHYDEYGDHTENNKNKKQSEVSHRQNRPIGRERERDSDYDRDRSRDRHGNKYDHKNDRDTFRNRESDRGRNRDMNESRERVRDRDRDDPDRSWGRDGERDRRWEGDKDKWARDRDRGIDRGKDRTREHNVDRERYGNMDKDRDRDRNRERNRDRDRRKQEYYSERSRYKYPSEFYPRGYEEDPYQRSRPSSRSGSRNEFDDYRSPRDYHAYGGGYSYYGRSAQGYPYNDPYYSYKYYDNLRRTNPAAYAEWYAKYYASQQGFQQGTYSEDRGSVHSGRSSANDESQKNRYLGMGHYHSNSLYHCSSLGGNYKDGRSQDHVDLSFTDNVGSTTPQRLTPAKFSTAHVKGTLTNRGQLIKILPHYPLDGQPATVELHDLSNIHGLESVREELQSFPGPLIKGTHKNSLINFCNRKIKTAERNPNLFDKESVILLWKLLILLLRQNGTVVGPDISELLLSNASRHSSGSSLSVRQSNSSRHSSRDCLVEDTHAAAMKTEEELTDQFREFLLYGNSKEALEWAMKHGLWGHALFLASKMDQRTYANVMMRFANGLPLNDPLQTLYQLMSGRQPAAVTCCSDEKWGDWRPHLAMILSNTSQRPEQNHKATITLGDTLGARGCLHASHFCYIMGRLEFGTYAQKSSKIVLLGSSHFKPFHEFATLEAIQMTEIYIYATQLGEPEFDIPQFQFYKYLYALKLAEHGMPSEAMHYAEVIGQSVLQQPSYFDVDFMRRVYDLGDCLKFHDPVYSTTESGEMELEDPTWLLQLKKLVCDYECGILQPEIPSYGSTSNLSCSESEQITMTGQPTEMPKSDDWTQHTGGNFYSPPGNQQAQFWPQNENQKSTQFAEVAYQTQQEPLQVGVETAPSDTLWNQQDNSARLGQERDNSHFQASVDSHNYGMSSGFEFQPAAVPPNTQHHGYEWASQNQEDELLIPHRDHHQGLASSNVQPQQQQQLHKPPATPEDKQKKRKEQTPKVSGGNSWFGGLFSKLSLKPKNQMILPDDKNPTIVWNPEKNRWTNLGEDGEEESGDVPPPPKASDLMKPVMNASENIPLKTDIGVRDTSAAAALPPSGSNIYKMNRGRVGVRANYVNVLGNSAKPANISAPPPELFSSIGGTPHAQMNFFIPGPVEENENASTDFLTPSSGVIGTSGNASEQQNLSRWSSTSSLSREVQSITSRDRRFKVVKDSDNQPDDNNQPSFGAPLMYNPNSFSQQTATPVRSSGTLGRKRYNH